MIKLELNNSCLVYIDLIEDVPVRDDRCALFCIVILKSEYEKEESKKVRKVIQFLKRARLLAGPKVEMIGNDQRLCYWLTPSRIAAEGETEEKATERVRRLLTGESRGITSFDTILDVKIISS